MKPKVIRKESLKAKEISSLRKRIEKGKLPSSQKRFQERTERQAELLKINSFFSSFKKTSQTLSKKEMVSSLNKKGFKTKEQLSFAFKKLGYKTAPDLVRLFYLSGFKKPSSLAECLKASGFRESKDFSYVSKFLKLDLKKQSFFLKKSNFVEVTSYVKGLYHPSPTLKDCSLFLKLGGFKKPSEVVKGFKIVGFTTPKDLIKGLHFYGFKDKTTILTALEINGYRGREILSALEKINP